MSLGHRFVEKNTSTVVVCGYEYTSNLRHRVDFFTFLRYNFCNKEVTEGNRMIDDNLEKLISQLPASPTVLNKSNVKKIHEYIPVPTDYKIRWADISSFGGYPAGIVQRLSTIMTWLKCRKKEVAQRKKSNLSG